MASNRNNRNTRQAPRARSGQAPVRRDTTPTYRASNRRTLGSAAPRVSTVKLGDLDAASAKGSVHRARAQASYKNYQAKVVAVLVAIAVLAGVFAGAFWSNLFAVRQVTVSGVEHLTASEMAQLANVPSDTTLLRVDTATIESNIMRDAWVENVHVQRVFPNTLNLAVTERTIGATVEIGVDDGKSTETWALSTDGIWLCRIPDKDSEAAQNISPKIYEDAENVFVITDVTYGVKPEVGKVCTDESVKNALDVVTSLSTDLKDQVKQVSATSTENTTLTLDSNVEIAFGAASDVRDKERVIKQILADHPGEVSYINVRVVKSPTWRTA